MERCPTIFVPDRAIAQRYAIHQKSVLRMHLVQADFFHDAEVLVEDVGQHREDRLFGLIQLDKVAQG